MDESGLHPVPNPSALFLSDRQQPAGVSSAVSITIEGTRPLLVEIQALCSRIHHQVRCWALLSAPGLHGPLMSGPREAASFV